jgi:hypothetical protein
MIQKKGIVVMAAIMVEVVIMVVITEAAMVVEITYITVMVGMGVIMEMDTEEITEEIMSMTDEVVAV